jgi:hypothetical protein
MQVTVRADNEKARRPDLACADPERADAAAIGWLAVVFLVQSHSKKDVVKGSCPWW